MTDLVFIDTETTGLDPGRHVVIDIWAERRRAQGLTLVAAAGGRVEVSPEELSAASPEALAINHYSAEGWQDARPWAAVWAEVLARVFLEHGPRLVVVGHNPRFDLAMIDSMHRRTGTSGAVGRCATIDTKHMADVLRRRGQIADCRLATVAAYYGLGEQDHSARGDVAMTVEVYRRMTGGAT